MILSHSKHYFIFSNVNEHLAVPFVKLTRNGSRVSHFRFCLHRTTLSGHSYSYTSLILLIASNLPCYLHFAFYLCVWSKSNVPLIHLTIKNVSGDMQYWGAEGGDFGALNYWEDLYWREADLKGVCVCIYNIYIYIYIYIYYNICIYIYIYI